MDISKREPGVNPAHHLNFLDIRHDGDSMKIWCSLCGRKIYEKDLFGPPLTIMEANNASSAHVNHIPERAA